MNFFGNDPKYPRRSIGIGALLLGITSFRLGGIIEHPFSDMTTNDYIALAIWLVLTVLSVINVRLGIAALPPDPKDPKRKGPRVDSPAV